MHGESIQEQTESMEEIETTSKKDEISPDRQVLHLICSWYQKVSFTTFVIANLHNYFV